MTHTLKPYPAYKPSGVAWLGEIPSSWDVAKVKYSSYLKARIGWQNLRTDEFVESGPYCVTGTDFKNGRIDWTNCYHVSQSRYDLDPKIQLDSNDILITKDGTIGKVAHVEELPDCATLNSGVFVVRPLKESYSTRFMYWVLSSNVFGSFIDYIRNGSTIHHLYQYSFERFQFPVPSRGEQHRIATFLDHKTAEIDEAISKKQRLIDLLKEQKAILIDQAVTKGLNPNVPMRDSGVEWIGEVPAHWEVISLRAAAHSIQTGPFGSQLHASDYVSGGIPVINPSHMRNGGIESDPSSSINQHKVEELSRHQLQPCDIVMARRGELGRCALVTDVEAGWLCGTGSLRIRPKSRIFTPAYLLLILNTQGIRDALSLSSVGATMDNLNAGMVSRLRLPLPPFLEQVAIVEYLDKATAAIATAIAHTRRQISLLQEYRAILIADVVTGKLDVREDAPHES